MVFLRLLVMVFVSLMVMVRLAVMLSDVDIASEVRSPFVQIGEHSFISSPHVKFRAPNFESAFSSSLLHSFRFLGVWYFL